MKDVNRMHDEFNEKAQSTYEVISEAPKKISEKISEAPKLMDESHDKLEQKARSIAGKYASLFNYNQRRIISSVKQFSIYQKLESLEKDETNLQSPINYLKDEIRKFRSK